MFNTGYNGHPKEMEFGFRFGTGRKVTEKNSSIVVKPFCWPICSFVLAALTAGKYLDNAGNSGKRLLSQQMRNYGWDIR